MECEYCHALLVDVFGNETAVGDDSITDPIELVDGARVNSGDTDALLAAARETSDEDSDPLESLQRLPRNVEYTGDLPRLFRFGDRYQILEKLGEGGMGRVYKALDLELDRAVALKTIRTEKGSGPEVLERFKQELILARKVTHKNVIRIYDLGESEGMKFFTMELVEGESLRDILRTKKKIPVKETLSLMTQMLKGLAEAHSQGVVHRDLKPQNIMMDESGVVRIMDFGIARTADSATMTGTGEMMGTPDYISPEQVKGETADAQSDLYSCGVILYELLTGETPFKGDTPISRIVSRIQVSPRPPRELNPDIPSYLERIILKCLEVDPELRYASAEDVLQDLEREQVDSSLWLRARKTVVRHRAGVAVACVIASVAIGYGYYLSGARTEASTPAATLAILPFDNTTGDVELDWMVEGIPEMLITDISQLRSLRPVTAERIHQLLDALGKAGQSDLDDETVKVIADMAGADQALHGRFIHSNEGLRLDLRLRDSQTGLMTRIKVQGSSSEVFALVDEVTQQVAAALGTSEKNRPLQEVITSDLHAFQKYHQGLRELRKGANQAAIPHLREAVERDPKFAMAYAKLAEAHFYAGNESDAREAIRTAKHWIEEVPPPTAVLYEIHAIAARIEDDPETAVKSYRELAKLFPDDPQVLFSLANSLEELGRLDEAIQAYRDVIAIAPEYGAALLGLGRMLDTAGRSDEAIPTLKAALDTGQFDDDAEALGMIHSILGVAHHHLTDYESAVSELQKSLAYRREANDSRGITATLTNLAIIQATLGRFSDAHALLLEGLEIARKTGNSTMESFALVNLGYVNLRAGRLEEALASYSDSLEIEWERRQHTELNDRLNLIGQVYSLMGRYADAMVYLEQAKVHIQASNDTRARSHNVFYVGQIHAAKGDYKEAVEAFLSAIPLLREAGELPEVAAAYDHLAAIYLFQGRGDEALRAVEQSVAVSEDLRIPLKIAQSRLQEARCLIELGRSDEAASVLRTVGEQVAGIESGEVGPHVKLVQGKLSSARGDFESAQSELQEAIDAWRTTGHLALQLEATVELAQALVEGRELQRAEDLLTEILEPLARRRLRPLLSRASLVLARAHTERGDTERARAELERAIALATEFDGRHLLDQASAVETQMDALSVATDSDE